MRLGSSIALLIIGGWYTYIMLNNGDYYGSRCAFGDGHFFASFFFVPLFFIVLITSLIASTIRYFSGKGKFNYLPIFATLLVISAYYIIDYVQTSPQFQSPTILFARTEYPSIPSDNIELRKNNRFTVFHSKGMAYCQLKGDYVLKGDTIRFLRDIDALTDGDVSNTYIIKKDSGFIIPVGKDGNRINEATKRMLIRNN